MICKYSDVSTIITAPAEMSFPYWYTVVKFFQGPIFQAYVQFVLPLMVGFYQMNTYLACSSPLIFKRYFKNYMLKYYYVLMHLMGIALFVTFIFRADLSTNLTNIYDKTIIVIQTLISIFHIGLSYLSLRAIFKYQKKRVCFFLI
uniref:Serpentine receptor class gamma n=1 Tax=Panagrolaimus sp. PS1159 TaxID=55785 RepID=A0AC35GQH2_9BILA